MPVADAQQAMDGQRLVGILDLKQLGLAQRC
jgi:hypothetical protein